MYKWVKTVIGGWKHPMSPLKPERLVQTVRKSTHFICRPDSVDCLHVDRRKDNPHATGISLRPRQPAWQTIPDGRSAHRVTGSGV